MSRPDPVTREMSPCKGCEQRNVGCHDHCEKYKEWRSGLDELNKARKKYENKRNMARGWMI